MLVCAGVAQPGNVERQVFIRRSGHPSHPRLGLRIRAAPAHASRGGSHLSQYALWTMPSTKYALLANPSPKPSAFFCVFVLAFCVCVLSICFRAASCCDGGKTTAVAARVALALALTGKQTRGEEMKSRGCTHTATHTQTTTEHTAPALTAPWTTRRTACIAGSPRTQGAGAGQAKRTSTTQTRQII